MNLKMEPVKSSNVDSVGYDPDFKVMAVRFKSGGTYHYHDVPASHHAELVGAKSIGGHHAKTCAKFRCVKQ